MLCIRFNGQAMKRCLAKIKSYVTRNTHSSSSKFEPDADLLSIGVLPDYRGSSRGVAEGLVGEFEKLMQRQSKVAVKTCALSVMRGNTRAIHFYEKCGFILWQEEKEEVKYIKYYKYIHD